jgi:hypothetical protein
MSATTPQPELSFMDLYNVLPNGGLVGADRPEFGTAELPEPFVAPTLFEIVGQADARVVMVSARGATGKSLLARRLSAMKQVPLWRLDLDKTVSAHALDAKLNSYLGPEGMKRFRADPDALVIVDALDEARMRVSGISWSEFLDSLVATSDAGRRLMLLGRERILEDVWLHFDDAGVPCSWFEISHFDSTQRIDYVDKGVAGRGKAASGAIYEQARDSVLAALTGTVDRNISEAFVGYAPVLDAVVALLAETNPMTVINDFAEESRATERVTVLMDILESLLTREQAKTVQIATELELDPSLAYGREEQLGWLASELMGAGEPSLEWCPEEIRGDYVTRIREFLRDHPFRSETRWASPVFSGFVAADRFGDEAVRGALQAIGRETGLLFDFVIAKEAASLIDEWQFAALHASMLAAEWKAVEAVVSIEYGSSASPVLSVGGELVLLEDGTSKGARVDLVLERGDELQILGPTSFLSADFPGLVKATPQGDSLTLGPDCYIRCHELQLRGETIEIARRAFVPGEIAAAEPSVVLEISDRLRIDGALAGRPSREAFEIHLPDAHPLAFPWVNYRGQWHPPAQEPDERAVRFLNMMMNLMRNHGHQGTMAVFDKKLEGRQSIKRAQFALAIGELETLGVVRRQGSMIVLQPSWEQHRYSGKSREGMPTLEDKREHWSPVLARISKVLGGTTDGG